jgi:hypothetical protein
VDEDFELAGLDGSTYKGAGIPCGAGVCSGGLTVCTAGMNAIECLGHANASPEVCNGLDDDCDGRADALDAVDLLANDGRDCENQDGVCEGATTPVSYCADGAWMSCDDAVYASWSGDFEIGDERTCDGLDNNCDGEIDEAGATTCDDFTPCTVDSCEGTCTHIPNDEAFCVGGVLSRWRLPALHLPAREPGL